MESNITILKKASTTIRFKTDTLVSTFFSKLPANNPNMVVRIKKKQSIKGCERYFSIIYIVDKIELLKSNNSITKK